MAKHDGYAPKQVLLDILNNWAGYQVQTRILTERKKRKEFIRAAICQYTQILAECEHPLS
jgi:hypothetical protein